MTNVTEISEKIDAAIADDSSADHMADKATQDEWERQKKMPRVWVVIPHSGPEDKEDRVYIGLNGVSYWIAKGERVPVPRVVAESLKDSVVDYWVKDVNYETQQTTMRRVKYMRYPYMIEGPCSDAEYKAWLKEHPVRKENE